VLQGVAVDAGNIDSNSAILTDYNPGSKNLNAG